MKKENMIFRLKMEISSLVNEMISKLPDTLFLSDSTTFLDPSMASGQYVAAIEQRLRKHGHSDENIKSRVFGVEKNMLRVNYAIKKNKLVGTYSVDKNDIPSILICNMKFDCIVGNPPYQRKVGPTKSEPIWQLFVENSIKTLNDGGYLCYVHPSGWRDVSGKYQNVKNILTSKNVKYLEIHSIDDGMKTFGAQVRYDWYVLKNVPSANLTEVKFQDGIIKTINLLALPFIPNGMYDDVKNLVSKTGERKCEVIFERTMYGNDKTWMSKSKDENFKYPCTYMINQGDKISFMYSSKKEGHFGIPKFIWSNGYIPSFGCVVDEVGEYGLTNFTYGIIDSKNNLKKIKQAFDSSKFRKLMDFCSISINSVDRKVISTFRKDFYKDFI